MSDTEKNKNVHSDEEQVKILKEEVSQLKILLAEKDNNFQTLEQKNKELSQYIWSGNLGTWNWDVVSNHIFFNEYWAATMGYGNEPMSLGFEEWQSLIHLDDREFLIKILNECIEGKRDSYEIEHRKITKGGEMKWFILSGKVVERDTNEKAKRIIGVHKDITDKKNALESKIYVEKLNTSVFQTMQEGIVIQAMDGSIISCNQSAEQILGLTYDQIVGRTSIDPRWNAIKEDGTPFPGEQHPAMVTIKTGLPQHNVVMGLNKPDGTLTWISIYSELLPNSNALFCLFYDITELKTINDQYLKQYYTLKGITESSQSAIFSIDKNYHYTSFNSAHKKAIKDLYNRDIELGKNALDYLENPEKEVAQKSLEKTFWGEYVVEVEYFGADNLNKRCYETTHSPIKDNHNQIVGVASISVDITDKKEAESKLKRTKDLLERTSQAAKIGTWEVDWFTQHTIWSRITRDILEVEDDFTPTSENVILFYKEGENRNKIIQLIREATEKGTSWDEEFLITTAKGKDLWVRAIGSSEFENDRCVRIYGAFQDIDQRKKSELLITEQNSALKATEEELLSSFEELIHAQDDLLKQTEALKVSEERYRKVVETQTDFVMLSLPDTTITFANEPLAKALGTTPKDMLGLKWLDFAPIEELIPTLEKIKNLSPENSSFIAENRDLRASGEYGWTQWIDQGIFDEKNQLIQIQSVGRDITLLKETQENLKALSDDYERVFEGTQDAMFLVKVQDDGSFTYIRNNKAHQRISGLTVDDLQGKTPQEVVGKEIGDILEANYKKCLESPGSITYEEELELLMGKVHSLTTLTYVLEDGKPAYIVGSVKDITEVRKFEQEKDTLLKRLENLAKHIPGFIFEAEMSPEKKIRFNYISQGVEDIYGIKPDEILLDADQLFSKIYPDDLEKILQITSMPGNLKEYSSTVEFRIYNGNGGILWLEGNRSAILMDDGTIIWYGHTADITQRKELTDEIYRLSLLAQRTTNGVTITDPLYRIIWANQAIKNITGYENHELIGKTPKIFQFEETDMETIEFVNSKLKKGEIVQFEILNKGKTGRIYWLDIEIQPLRDEKGNLTGFMSLQTDITERKNIEDEKSHLLEITQNQNQRLAEFTYITSHNIRSSVANMLGLFTLINEDRQNEKFFTMLETSVYQLDDTIRTMNDLLNIEYDSQNLERKNMQLLQAVKNNVELLQFQMQDVDLEIDIPQDLTVWVIPSYLDSILNNLLTNAIKYRREDTQSIIKIKAQKEANLSVFSIEDNGIGMDLEKYSEKLFKLKSRLYTKVEGKGIGLYLAKHQIEAMGGKITVESTPEVGSTFKVYFYELAKEN